MDPNFLNLFHEKVNPRPDCAYYVCASLPADWGNFFSASISCFTVHSCAAIFPPLRGQVRLRGSSSFKGRSSPGFLQKFCVELGTDQDQESGPVEPNTECERYSQAAITPAVRGKILESRFRAGKTIRSSRLRRLTLRAACSRICTSHSVQRSRGAQPREPCTQLRLPIEHTARELPSPNASVSLALRIGPTSSSARATTRRHPTENVNPIAKLRVFQ